MIEKNRRSIRLKGHDYTQPGACFVTLTTWQREALFGRIEGGEIHLNRLGRIVEAQWWRLAATFPWMRFEPFVVMPNHLHGLIIIEESFASGVRATHPSPKNAKDGIGGSPITLGNKSIDSIGASPTHDGNQAANCPTCSPGVTQVWASLPFTPTSLATPDGSPLPANQPRLAKASLGAVIAQFKSRVTRQAWRLDEYQGSPIWHRNYYEHILRNAAEWARICAYIEANPLNWQEDMLNPSATTPASE